MLDIEFNGFLFCLFFGRIIVNIIHNTSDYLPKVLRFLNVAFDSSGDCLFAGDHHGNIYVFDLCGKIINNILLFESYFVFPAETH